MSSVGTRWACVVAGTRSFISFASKEGQWEDEHTLCSGDVGLFRGSTQLDWTIWGQADRVQVRFRSSKGDLLRDGTIMTRACAGPPLSPIVEWGRGSRVKDLIAVFLSVSSLTCATGGVWCRMW